MRILQVHKYLYRRDGAAAYLLDLTDLLKENGHQARLWGTNDKVRGNDLVDYLDFDKRQRIWKKLGHMLWSPEAAEKLEKVIQEFQPDIIHLHNIYHHLSSSILAVAKKHKIPMVMTVHDYKLINPNYTLFDHGEICERKGIKAIFHKCVQNSFGATLAGVLESKISKKYNQYIQKYIVPTNFVKDKLIANGIDKNKIVKINLPVDIQKESKLGDYILYAGRLAKEKGINLLLDVAKQLSDIQFKIAGEGMELKTSANVELLGFLEKEKLQKIIFSARLVVVPSLWYDPSPYAALEAMAAGKAVIGSNIGGIANLIKDNETGFLANKNEWVEKLKKIYPDKELLKRVGESAREYIKENHSFTKHYREIEKVYKGLL